MVRPIGSIIDPIADKSIKWMIIGSINDPNWGIDPVGMNNWNSDPGLDQNEVWGPDGIGV